MRNIAASGFLGPATDKKVLAMGDGDVRVRSSTVAVSVILMAFSAPSAIAGAPHMRELTTSELQALVPGTLIKSDLSRTEVRTTDGGEIFHADGAYTKLADRASINGTYSIESGRICISLETTRTRDCRVIQVEAPGKYHFARPSPAPDTSAWPITVERLPR